MNEFWFLTVCNKPRLRDPTKVQEIVQEYWFDWDCEVRIEQYADCAVLNIEGECWPDAWRRPVEDSSDGDLPDAFEEFLAAVAPYLEEPLIIQAIGTATGEFPLAACQWTVNPQSGVVSKVEFSSLSKSTALTLAAA
jgi:hypothetical protein